MRRLTAILLLCCLLFVTGGYYAFFLVQRAEIRVAMKAELLEGRTDGIATMNFSKTEAASLSWEDEAEFQWQGEMYDVLQKEVRGDSVVLRCIADKKETALIDHFLQIQKRSSQNGPSSVVLKLLSAPFVVVRPQVLTVPEQPLLCRFISAESILPLVYVVQPVPPPQLQSC